MNAAQGLKQRFSHKKLNDYLAIIVVTLGLYIVIMPWLPQISLWLSSLFDQTDGFVYRGDLSTGKVDDNVLKAPPEDNRLVIPSIKLDETIKEGNSLAVLNDGGTWRRPNTSFPNEDGNTVIIGHRFSYSDPSTFYHLDKLKIGDRFAVWWQQEEIIYEVYETLVVPATAVDIENQTADRRLTLYTCTPLWTAQNRLVVRSRPVTEIAEDML